MSNRTLSDFDFFSPFTQHIYCQHVRKSRAYLGKAVNEVFRALHVNAREKCEQGGGWLGGVCNNTSPQEPDERMDVTLESLSPWQAPRALALH